MRLHLFGLRVLSNLFTVLLQTFIPRPHTPTPLNPAVPTTSSHSSHSLHLFSPCPPPQTLQTHHTQNHYSPLSSTASQSPSEINRFPFILLISIPLTLNIAKVGILCPWWTLVCTEWNARIILRWGFVIAAWPLSSFMCRWLIRMFFRRVSTGMGTGCCQRTLLYLKTAHRYRYQYPFATYFIFLSSSPNLFSSLPFLPS